MKAVAVIGMNYGDEGKGHIVNYLSGPNTLNVRFNGGAQASHAVFLADGRNHIFHHFGSGSLRGARTLLASHFIVNPVIYAWELRELTEKTPMREVFIDPRCRVTTPYDMLVNEFTARHHGKFDTVGVGINETVERSMYSQLRINMRDFTEKSDDELTTTLKRIEGEYLPYRIKQLKVPWDEFKQYYDKIVVDKDSAVKSFLKIREWMNRTVVVWPDDSVVDKFLAKDPTHRDIVFEAGQGMLLDQNRKEFFPHLTRSSTGVTNVLELLNTVRAKLDFEALLVTRTYLTRHGDGPIWNHVPNTYPFPKIEEPTNPNHTFQGKMRYGHLSMAWYKRAIEEITGAVIKAKLNNIDCFTLWTAMTCLDHVGGEFSYSLDGDNNITKGDMRDFPQLKLLSSGHTEKDIKPL